MGIWVSTRDFNEVGYTVNIESVSAELEVDGGDSMSLFNVDVVVANSFASKFNPLVGNWRLGEKVAFPGESPFMVMPLKVSSRPREGEFFIHGDWIDGESIVFRGDVSRDAPKYNRP